MAKPRVKHNRPHPRKVNGKVIKVGKGPEASQELGRPSLGFGVLRTIPENHKSVSTTHAYSKGFTTDFTTEVENTKNTQVDEAVWATIGSSVLGGMIISGLTSVTFMSGFLITVPFATLSCAFVVYKKVKEVKDSQKTSEEQRAVMERNERNTSNINLNRSEGA